MHISAAPRRLMRITPPLSNVAATVTTLAVPVIDLTPFYSDDTQARNELAKAIDKVCQDIGFLVVTGHPVDHKLIQKVRDVTLEFFDLPETEKLKIKQPNDDELRGYGPMLSEGLSYSIGKKTPPDLKECLTIGPPGFTEARYLLGDEYYTSKNTCNRFVPNLWPAEPRALRPLWEEYFRVMMRFGIDLHHLFCVALGLPEDYFDGFIDKTTSAMRALHYPPLSDEPEPGQTRAGEHSDYDNLTICHVDPGLQARNRDGDWVDVPVVQDGLVVNLGDFLMRWTNDRWISTRHRVINPPLDSEANRGRLSLICFYECNCDALIECLPTCQSDDQPAKYPPITAANYVAEKYTRQTRFEQWSEASTDLYGTGETESRFDERPHP